MVYGIVRSQAPACAAPFANCAYIMWTSYCCSVYVLQYGSQDVHLSAAEQLVDRSQTRAVADAMKWLQARLNQQHPQQQQQGGKTLRQWLEELEAAVDQQVRVA